MNLTSSQRIQYGIAGALTLLMFVLFFPVMWQKWFESDSYYSHGPLIPLVSAYLIWRMRDQLAKLEVLPCWWGLPLLVFGVALRVFAAYEGVNFLSGFSLVIVLVGLALFLLGRRVAFKLLFPLLFLLAMIPLSQLTITKISYELKTFAAEIASRVLPAIGVSVHRAGSEIEWVVANAAAVIPGRDSLIVDDVCSGLRSMIALLAFGAVFAYISPCSLRKRLELFAASIPCSVLANMMRIVVITLIAYFWGSKTATVHKYIPNPFGGEGFTIHDATGILIFIVAFIGFFTYEKLLNRPRFRLPKAAGARAWVLDSNGKLVTLAGNQLECLIRSGMIGPNDQVRQAGSAQWQNAASIPQFALSPRSRKLRVQRLGTEATFEQCIEMARSGELHKDDLLSFTDGTAMTRASHFAFLRPYWPAGSARIAGYAALYGLLPIVLFFIVQLSSGLGSLAEGKPGVLLVTIVLWFVVRTAMLGAGTLLHLGAAPERALPAPPAAQPVS